MIWDLFWDWFLVFWYCLLFLFLLFILYGDENGVKIGEFGNSFGFYNNCYLFVKICFRYNYKLKYVKMIYFL